MRDQRRGAGRLSNLKGTGSQVKPAVLGLPTTFPSVAAGTAAAANQLPVTITNKDTVA